MPGSVCASNRPVRARKSPNREFSRRKHRSGDALTRGSGFSARESRIGAVFRTAIGAHDGGTWKADPESTVSTSVEDRERTPLGRDVLANYRVGAGRCVDRGEPTADEE